MIVLGADMHKSSHTIAAVVATTGELLGDGSVEVGDRGFAAMLDWARGLGAERVWALEDCRLPALVVPQPETTDRARGQPHPFSRAPSPARYPSAPGRGVALDDLGANRVQRGYRSFVRAARRERRRSGDDSQREPRKMRAWPRLPEPFSRCYGARLMRLAGPAAITWRASDPRVVLLAALMSLSLLALVPPSSVRAAGDTTHTFMADEAIGHTTSSKLRRLLTANRVALLSGAAYPDSGYYVDDRPGGDFGEISHWERFINAYVRHIRATGCGSLAEPRGPCASLIAHMMGAAAHGVADEMWDWLFEPLVTDHGERHQSIEFAMDMIAIADFTAPAFTPYLPPLEELLAIYRSVGRNDITREGILAGHAATVGVLDIERQIAPEASAQIRGQMPWSAAHMYSESGGVRDVAEAAAGYYEALWRKLRAREGRHPRPRVIAVHPEFGERGVPYRWQPPRTSPGPHTGGGEQRIIAVLSNSLDAASVNAQSFRLLDAGNRPVPALAGYPRAGPYHTDDGTHSMLFYPATDLRPCTRYRAVVTTRIRDHAGATPRRRFAWPFITRPASDRSGAPAGRCGAR